MVALTLTARASAVCTAGWPFAALSPMLGGNWPSPPSRPRPLCLPPGSEGGGPAVQGVETRRVAAGSQGTTGGRGGAALLTKLLRKEKSSGSIGISLVTFCTCVVRAVEVSSARPAWVVADAPTILANGIIIMVAVSCLPARRDGLAEEGLLVVVVTWLRGCRRVVLDGVLHVAVCGAEVVVSEGSVVAGADRVVILDVELVARAVVESRTVVVVGAGVVRVVDKDRAVVVVGAVVVDRTVEDGAEVAGRVVVVGGTVVESRVVVGTVVVEGWAIVEVTEVARLVVVLPRAGAAPGFRSVKEASTVEGSSAGSAVTDPMSEGPWLVEAGINVEARSANTSMGVLEDAEGSSKAWRHGGDRGWRCSE